MSGSTILFLINIAGVVFASMISFSLMNLHNKKKIADTTIKQEEKRLEVEKEKAVEFKEKVQNNIG